MFIHSSSSTSLFYSAVEFVNQERLKVLVAGIALGILLISAAYAFYSCFWHTREVRKLEDLEKKENDLTLIFEEVHSDAQSQDLPSEKVEEKQVVPKEKQPIGPDEVLAAQNQLLAKKIRTATQTIFNSIDHLIAVQTHVHRIFDNVYLGNFRSFLSIDSRFVRKYAMVDSKEEIVKSLQACDRHLPYKEAENIYENYKRDVKKGCAKLNIKHVISVTQFTPAATVAADDWSRFQPDLKSLGVDRLQIPVDDDAFAWDTIVPHLDAVFYKIDQARLNYEPILLHCVQGSSRSAAVLIAYLMNRCGVSYEEALSFVKDKRPQAEPKPSLAKALQDYQQMLEIKFKKPE